MSAREHKVVQKLMGSVFELILVDDDVTRAERLLDAGIAEIKRLEDLLTEFKDTSDTALLNAHAGLSPVKVDAEVYQLLGRCLHLSALTRGAFDITVGPLKKLYRFKDEIFTMPDPETIKETLNRTGYRHILLQENNQVYLDKQGMHLSFAAIGKGYAADRVKVLWQSMGVQHGVINASGDLTVIGRRADNTPWKVGIANPDRPSEILFYLPVEQGSVATSGDYEQHFVYNGTRYSHNIDPKTGYPLSGIKSVTVISPAAELSDALATAVYVLGIKAGLHLIDQLPQTHCLIINDDNAVFYSKNLNIEHANR